MQTKTLVRFLILILGFSISSLGIYFSVEANLGTMPWTVFHIGVSRHVPLTIGQVTQSTGIVLIVLSYIFGIRAHIGTFLNMFFIGFFYDVYDKIGLLTTPETWSLQLVYLLAGIGLFALGAGVYISASLGAGPRDGLMLGLHKRLNWSIQRVRSIMEIAVLVIGVILGGPIGLGTVIFGLAIGPSMQLSINFFRKVFSPLVQPTPAPVSANSGK